MDSEDGNMKLHLATEQTLLPPGTQSVLQAPALI
jgi:hypothetical protein